MLRREMEVYAGYMEYTDYHVGRILDGLKKLDILDDTLVYYIIGDNGASAEGGLNGCVQRDELLQRPAGARNAGVSHGAARQTRRAGVLQPLRRGLGARHEHALPVDQAGRLALGRHAQRHHRPLAEGDQAKGEMRSQFHHVIDVAPTILEAAGPPGAGLGERHPAGPDRGRQHAVLVQRRQGGGAARDAVFRDVRQPRHLPQGLDRGDEAPDTLGLLRRRRFRPSTTTSGSSTTRTTDWSQAKDLSKQMPEKLHELQRLWLIEATRYKVLPLDDRMVEKMNPDTAGRPVLIKGKTQILFGGMGRLPGELRRQPQEQVALRHRRDRGAGEGRRGRHRLPGRQHRRLEPVREEREAQVLLQLGRLQALLRRGQHADPGGRAPGAHGVRLRRRRSGQGRQGHAATSTARRSARAILRPRWRWSFPPTTVATSARTAAHPCPRTTAPQGNAFNGRVKGVQLAIAEAAENLDHLISPEVAVHLAMARQ